MNRVVTKSDTTMADLEIKSGDLYKAGSYGISFEFRFFLVCVLAVVLYFIAASVQSGWIFLISATLLCVAVCATCIPLLSLDVIRVFCQTSETVPAGQAVPVHVQLSSRGSLLPSAQLIVCLLPSTEAGFTVENHRLLFESVEKDRLISSESPVVVTCARRGKWSLPDVLVQTSYPFGLLWANRVFHSTRNIIVLPVIKPMECRFLYGVKSSQFVPGSGRLSSSSGYQSSASRGAREYIRGDNRRHINWSLSARHNKLMVKEFDLEGLATYDIALATFADWQSASQFELAITTCASLAKFGHDQGIYPQLHVLHEAPSSGSLPPHTLDLQDQLIMLAELPAATPGSIDWNKNLSFLSGRSRALLLVLPFNCELDTDSIPSGVTIVGIAATQKLKDKAVNSSSFVCVWQESDLLEM